MTKNKPLAKHSLNGTEKLHFLGAEQEEEKITLTTTAEGAWTTKMHIQ